MTQAPAGQPEPQPYEPTNEELAYAAWADQQPQVGYAAAPGQALEPYRPQPQAGPPRPYVVGSAYARRPGMQFLPARDSPGCLMGFAMPPLLLAAFLTFGSLAWGGSTAVWVFAVGAAVLALLFGVGSAVAVRRNARRDRGEL